jgi:hypothetical protein
MYSAWWDSRVLIARMRAMGAQVQNAGDAFPFKTADEEWLAACGERQWFVLTRDKYIRRRVLEREALQHHEVGAFAFTSGQATASETADSVTRVLLKMANIAVSEPRPFLYTFGLNTPLVRVPSRLLR